MQDNTLIKKALRNWLETGATQTVGDFMLVPQLQTQVDRTLKADACFLFLLVPKSHTLSFAVKGYF